MIEAIVEDEPTKTALYRELSAIVRPDCVLASNTSSIPISRLAAAARASGAGAGHALLQPGAGAAAGRAGPVPAHWTVHCGHGAGVRRGPAGQEDRARARTAPGSWSTRCWCPTCWPRSGWSRPAWPPPRTSTPRWSPAPTTRWDRSRSPTSSASTPPRPSPSRCTRSSRSRCTRAPPLLLRMVEAGPARPEERPGLLLVPGLTCAPRSLGRPVGHSLSPVLHTAAYAALGLPTGRTRPIDCGEAGAAGAGRRARAGLGRAVADHAAQAGRARGRRTPSTRWRRRSGRRTRWCSAAADGGRTRPTWPGSPRRCARPASPRRSPRSCSAPAAPPRPRWPRWARSGWTRRWCWCATRPGPGELRATADRLGLALDLRAGLPGPVPAADLVVSTLPAGAADGLAAAGRSGAARRGLRALADPVRGRRRPRPVAPWSAGWRCCCTRPPRRSS